MVFRRQLLCGSGAVIAGAIAGCTSLRSSSDDDREYSIGVYNDSDTARTFRIQIGERPGEFFHLEEVELEAETADETIPFDGVPGSLSVTVDEGEQWDQWKFPWPVQRGGGAPAAEANIAFGPEYAEQDIVVSAGVRS